MPSHIIHPIPPVFDADSRILILGSFPSVKSRESCFFYGHPQNRFWKLLTRLRKEGIPTFRRGKEGISAAEPLAVWDTIHQLFHRKDPATVPSATLSQTTSPLFWITLPSRRFTQTAGCLEKMYDRFCRKQTGIEAIKLPSTSPANAAWNLDRLTDAWKCINQILGEPGSETKNTVSDGNAREAKTRTI